MKNLWILAIGSLVMTGCIENTSTETVKEDKKEVISTSNEIENPPRVESPADVNLREGQEFLAANATNEDVVELESGVQLLELIPGSGKIPTMENNVTVHYHGTLIDGTIFTPNNQALILVAFIVPNR